MMTLGLLIHGFPWAHSTSSAGPRASSRARVGLLLNLAREDARGPAAEVVQCR